MSYTANLSSPDLFSLFKLGAIRKQRCERISSFYLSFEDALWEVIKQHRFENKKVLLPSFFCADVSSRIAERGFDLYYYSLDEDLRFNHEDFLNQIKNSAFAFVVIYYPMGMKDSVPSIEWFRELLTEKTLLIEDYADTLLAENEIKIIDSNHIAIDSVRKLLPIQGARIWQSKLPSEINTFNIYRLRALILWNLCRFIGFIFNILKFNWIDNIRWHIFSMHSDLIGSSSSASRGFKFDRMILDYICVDKYKSLRCQVIQFYIDSFSLFEFHNPWGMVKVAKSDISNTRFIVFRGPKGSLSKLSEQLEQHGISNDTHFDDSPLGLKFDFLLLPTSFNINKDITDKIAQICFNFYKTNASL
jgi:hypothetical protein